MSTVHAVQGKRTSCPVSSRGCPLLLALAKPKQQHCCACTMFGFINQPCSTLEDMWVCPMEEECRSHSAAGFPLRSFWGCAIQVGIAAATQAELLPSGDGGGAVAEFPLVALKSLGTVLYVTEGCQPLVVSVLCTGAPITRCRSLPQHSLQQSPLRALGLCAHQLWPCIAGPELP